MRVIEENHIHEKESFCNHCGAVLGYYPADVIVDGTKPRLIRISIICPICNHRIILHEFTLENYFIWEKEVFQKWKDGI